MLNLEQLRIVDSSGMGTENEGAEGSNKETDLRQFINSRYVVLHFYLGRGAASLVSTSGETGTRNLDFGYP